MPFEISQEFLNRILNGAIKEIPKATLRESGTKMRVPVIMTVIPNKVSRKEVTLTIDLFSIDRRLVASAQYTVPLDGILEFIDIEMSIDYSIN